jgi:hypothetical protein
MNIDARKRSATNGEAQKRAELLQALGTLIEEHEKLAGLLKKQDWTDYRGVAKPHLEKLSTQLAAQAAKLEEPQ